MSSPDADPDRSGYERVGRSSPDGVVHGMGFEHGPAEKPVRELVSA